MFRALLFLGLALLMTVLGIVFCIATAKKKKSKRVLISILIFGLGILFFIMAFVSFLFRNYGVRKYDTYEEFEAATQIHWDYPEGAKNPRMVVDDRTLSKTMLLSFSMDEAYFNDFIFRTAAAYYAVETEPWISSVHYEDNEYYTLSVSEIDDVNSDYELDDFPYHLAFDEVIDDSVDDYTVLYYRPVNTGTSGYAVLINEDTNTVLEYYFAAAR